jgi:hypothetical protein
MRKPTCKMSLKDMLEYLTSLDRELPGEPGLPYLGEQQPPIQDLHRLIPLKIDEDTQETAILHRGRHPIGNN